MLTIGPMRLQLLNGYQRVIVDAESTTVALLRKVWTGCLARPRCTACAPHTISSTYASRPPSAWCASSILLNFSIALRVTWPRSSWVWFPYLFSPSGKRVGEHWYSQICAGQTLPNRKLDMRELAEVIQTVAAHVCSECAGARVFSVCKWSIMLSGGSGANGAAARGLVEWAVLQFSMSHWNLLIVGNAAF